LGSLQIAPQTQWDSVKREKKETRKGPGRNRVDGRESVPWQEPGAARKSLPVLFIDECFFSPPAKLWKTPSALISILITLHFPLSSLLFHEYFYF
jgi:hypothetical protein